MSYFLRSFPGRQIELGLTVFLAIGMILAIWWNRAEPTGAVLVLVTLEILLPFAFGTVAAGLLADDPAIDLLLTVPQPAPRTLGRRLGTLLGLAALVSGAIQLLAAAWGIQLPIRGIDQLAIWTVPTLLFSGIATVSALVRGRILDGLAAVLGAWGAMLITMPFITTICEETAAQSCAVAVFSPAMTVLRPLDAGWGLNRGVWGSVGLILLMCGIILARNEERLVNVARAE